MNLREIKQRIWSAIGVGMGESGRDVNKELEAAKELIFNFEEPSRSLKFRWDRALHEVIMTIFNKGGMK